MAMNVGPGAGADRGRDGRHQHDAADRCDAGAVIMLNHHDPDPAALGELNMPVGNRRPRRARDRGPGRCGLRRHDLTGRQAASGPRSLEASYREVAVQPEQPELQPAAQQARHVQLCGEVLARRRTRRDQKIGLVGMSSSCSSA